MMEKSDSPKKKMSIQSIGILKQLVVRIRMASRAAELEKQREPREPENPKDSQKRKQLVAKESQKERDNPKHGVTHNEFDITKPRHGSVIRTARSRKKKWRTETIELVTIVPNQILIN